MVFDWLKRLINMFSSNDSSAPQNNIYINTQDKQSNPQNPPEIHKDAKADNKTIELESVQADQSTRDKQ